MLFFPALHELKKINLQSFKLTFSFNSQDLLFNKDELRAEMEIEFYYHVKPTHESVSKAARSLGEKTLNQEELNEFIESKFRNGVRLATESVKRDMLTDNIDSYLSNVENKINELIGQNGLELESCTVIKLVPTHDVK